MKKLMVLALAMLLILAGHSSDAARAAENDASRSSEAHWVEIPGAQGDDTFCFGTNAVGTHFLVGTVSSTEKGDIDCHMVIYDSQTGKQTELSFADSVDVGELTSRFFLDELITDRKLDKDAAAARPKEYSGNETLAMKRMWNGWPTFIETHGDFVLLMTRGNGYVLINMKTGQTTPLLYDVVTLAQDGRAAICSDGKVRLYDPRSDTYTAFTLKSGNQYRPMSAQLLSDGTAVCALRGTKMTNMASEAILAFCAADGSTTQSIKVGSFRIGAAPESVLYSEQAGVGIAYNKVYIKTSPARIFRKGSDAANVLWLDSADATHAKEASPSDVLDDTGRFSVAGGYALLPMGISKDGSSALLVAFDENNINLILMNLDTLEVRTLFTAPDLQALFAQRSLNHQPLVALSYFGWNGTNLLAGPNCPPNSVLFLPIE